jgi:endonuclease-3
MARRKKISIVAREVRGRAIGAALEREFPEAKCALNFETPDQLLFATILSAQCTDVRVNLVTPALFKRWPGSKELSKAKVSEVEKVIKSINFFRNKSKNLVNSAKLIQEIHGGQLPSTMEELIALPGVGRKTANVVLGDAFNIQVGVVVDTHVKRIAGLLGLTEEEDPVKIEQDLMEIVPKENWTKFSHWLILHGRRTCIARRPKCGECVIRKFCDFGQKEVFS